MAPGTLKSYQSGISHFKAWRAARGTHTADLITSEELCLWLAHAADKGGLKAATLSSYLTAMRYHCMCEQHPDSQERNPTGSQQVQGVLRGIEQAQNARRLASSAAEKANSPPLLYSTLMKYTFNPEIPRDHMIFAAAALGVAGALRPSEFLSVLPGRQLLTNQLAFYAEAAARTRMLPHEAHATHPVICVLTLRVTKTTQTKDTVKVISVPQAVGALWRWCAYTRRKGDAPVFMCLITQRALTVSALTGDLNRRHTAAGLGHINYTGKSFRRGGASSLALRGLNDEDIAAIGWAPGSTMWRLYADDPAVQLARAIDTNQQMDAAAAAAGNAAKYWAHRPRRA